MVHIITTPTAFYPLLSDLKLITAARLAGLKDFFTNKNNAKIVDIPSPNGDLVKSSSENEVNGTDDKGKAFLFTKV